MDPDPASEPKPESISESAPKPKRVPLSESDIKADIRKRCKEIGVVIWAQATGKGQTDTGSDIRFGLCRGSSDLIGIDSRTGLFVAVEVKTPSGLRAHELALKRAKSKIEGQHVGGKKALTKQEQRALEQQMFVDLVNRSRGAALFATSFEDVAEAVSRARLRLTLCGYRECGVENATDMESQAQMRRNVKHL